MKPYFETELGKLYNGNCAEIIKTLEIKKNDLILIDPPYGIKHPVNYLDRGRGAIAKTHNYLPVYGDQEPFNPTWLIEMDIPLIMWGANHYSDKLPVSSGWLVWDKRMRNDKGTTDQSDGELAWTNIIKGVRIFRHLWAGMWKASERGECYHPTQKPIKLFEWILNLKWIPDGTIFDLYCGSGPIAIACERLNRRWIGIEIIKEYCDITIERIKRETAQYKFVEV